MSHILSNEHVDELAEARVEGPVCSGLSPVVNPEGQQRVTVLGDTVRHKVPNVVVRSLLPVRGSLVLGLCHSGRGLTSIVREVNDVLHRGIRKERVHDRFGRRLLHNHFLLTPDLDQNPDLDIFLLFCFWESLFPTMGQLYHHLIFYAHYS